jgi:hypothetical protein
MTLKPGDVILTGTPPGVGCFKKPPVFLKVNSMIINPLVHQPNGNNSVCGFSHCKTFFSISSLERGHSGSGN